MQFVQKQTYRVIWLILLIFACTAQNALSAEKSQTAENGAAEIRKPDHHLVVTYFHTTYRCPTCIKIEKLSSEAVNFNFEEELNSGKIVWQAINVDEAQHKHYVKDYQLYSKHLIISEVKDGKEVRWKDLKAVWVHVRDEVKFNEYVKTEISDWLKE